MKATRTLIASALLMAATLASAQMPVALRDANAPAAGDWAKASAVLRAAIECREALPPVASVLGTFGLTNRQLDGDHKLPEALTVFGSLKVASISIFNGDEEEGISYTVQPVGAKMAEVVKAASLKKDGPRFIRKVKGGLIEASEPQPGTVQLACIRGGGHE
ncbi:hypothetical protein [Iodobacter sp. BJB302]|uniref:hypothetical protein n=1 Tax=Iodobacter sp. BJB302 TaxID=1506510 RepID=UPI000C0FF707|nr:hypothetical protein [Iodobacter sp. BJB302]PHV00757.1 hypothetical protein CSQ88_15470 [Iodobacter sp. BJB302]